MSNNTTIKVLLYTYSPAATTGLSTIAKHLAKSLNSDKKIDLSVYAIKDDGNPKDQAEFPYPIYAFAQKRDQDIYARNHFLQVIRGEVSQLAPPFDIIILFLPPEVLVQPTDFHPDGVIAHIRSLQKDAYMKQSPQQWFKTMGYFPIDASLDPASIENAIAITDQPVLLSDFGHKTLLEGSPGLKKAVTLIKPPVDTGTFHPLESQEVNAFRDEFFRGQVDPSTFLISTIAKNYYLNDLTRTLVIFKEFFTTHPNSFLYLHTDAHGPFVDLELQAKQMGLELFTHWAYSGSLSAGMHTSTDELNHIYNASDAILSTSQATWWGNHVLEAMATKTLVLAPYHSAFAEHLTTTPLDSGETTLDPTILRGIPLQTNADISAWTTYGSVDQHRLRPLVSVQDAITKLAWANEHPKKVKQITKNAYEYAKSQSPQAFAKNWQQTVHKLHKKINSERQHPQETISKLFG